MKSNRFKNDSTPSIKPTVQRNDIGGNIFLRSSARVTEVENNNIYHAIISLIDGKKPLNIIVEDLCSRGYQKKEIYDALDEIDELFLLEDNSILSHELSDSEKSRWSRNLNFFGSFLHYGCDKSIPQRQLRDCKVTLLGLGGLGSHLLYDLAALGCMDILAVEFDNVEISNLNRQILYTPADIGKSKSAIAKKRMADFSPNLKFEVYNKKIEDMSDVAAVVLGRDIAICVADRPKTEILHWVNHACVNEGIPLLTGGLDTQLARYYCTLPGEGCLECWRTTVRENSPKDNMILDEQRRTQLRGDNAAFIPFVAIIAGLIIADLTKIVTRIGGKPVSQNKTQEISFSTMNIITGETWELNPMCSCCSEKLQKKFSCL